MKVRLLVSLIIGVALLPACATHTGSTRSTPATLPSDTSQDGAPAQPIDIHQIPDVQVRAEPRSRAGNAPSYSVFGKTYRVLDNAEGFTQRGIAS